MQPVGNEFSAWYAAKSDVPASWGELLSVAGQFAIDHGLLQLYQTRFAGISLAELQPRRAEVSGRSASAPIWEIANELIVGRYLERVLGWSFTGFEPPGRLAHRGEWQFQTAGGDEVFVEVKTVNQREIPASTGAYSRADYRPKIRDILKGAYRQLPDDDRATLVVLVGTEILSVSHGIMLGDLFQALFGVFQVRFKPFEDDLSFTDGPSFRDTFVHGTKHRRLGCVAGLCVRVTHEPVMGFYAIDNPYATSSKRIRASDLTNTRRFAVDENGRGEDLPGLSPSDAWRLMTSE